MTSGKKDRKTWAMKKKIDKLDFITINHLYLISGNNWKSKKAI